MLLPVIALAAAFVGGREVGVEAGDLAAGFPFADVHHPFIAEKPRDAGANKDYKKSQVKHKQRVLLAAPRMMNHKAAGQINSQQSKQYFKPGSFVNGYARRNGSVVVFYKGGNGC